MAANQAEIQIIRTSAKTAVGFNGNIQKKEFIIMQKKSSFRLKKTIACLLIVFSLVLPFYGDKLPEKVKVLDLVKITLANAVKLLDDGQYKEQKDQ